MCGKQPDYFASNKANSLGEVVRNRHAAENIRLALQRAIVLWSQAVARSLSAIASSKYLKIHSEPRIEIHTPPFWLTFLRVASPKERRS